MGKSQHPGGKLAPDELRQENLVVVVASADAEHCHRIKGILQEQKFRVVDQVMPSLATPDSGRLKPSALVVQVEPDPAVASSQIACLRSKAPDVPILFAVDQNSEQLEINVRKMGIQYYMLLPAETEELIVVVNSLARA